VPQHTDLDKDLQAIEAALRKLESEYNMYFAGQLPRPPLESRRQVERMLNRLDRGYVASSADRFRLGALQSRYATFGDLWDRGLRAREEGRPGPFSKSARAPGAPASGGPESAPTPAPVPAPVPASERTPPAPAPRVDPARDAAADREFGRATLGGAGIEAAKLRALYDSLVEARKAVGAPGEFPFSRFSDIVRGQVARFRHTGSEAVAFRVATREGRVVFTAQGRRSADDEPPE
jgi:hypothetical protein